MSTTDANTSKKFTASRAATATSRVTSKPKTPASHLSGGAIAAIVVGIVAFIAIVLGVVAFLIVWRRRNKAQKPTKVVKMPTWYGDPTDLGDAKRLEDGNVPNLNIASGGSDSETMSRTTLSMKKSQGSGEAQFAELGSDGPERRIEMPAPPARAELPS